MFVLEDKAVTKTNFMGWYQDCFDHKDNLQHFTEVGVRAQDDTWLGDTKKVPYCAGSAYVSNPTTPAATSKYVATETNDTFGAKSDGTDEFLIDWRQFYKHDDSATTPTNPLNEVFHNTLPCTTDWDGSYDHSVLPINKSRFIVHEHKKWTIKPDSKGNVKQCIPWNYTFPEHYMSYEKQLLDLPFYYSNTAASTDDQGINAGLLFPRKQPFIVFCWSKSSHQGPLHIPNTKVVPAVAANPTAVPPVLGSLASKESGFNGVNHDEKEL